jgi:YesN/AraC family two-component response regulator
MYHCHAGLAEMIAPIMGKDSNSNDEPVAYLMVGQIRETTEIRHHEKVKEKAGRLHLAETALTDASKRLTVLRAGELQACGNILQALASYIWLDHFVRVQNEPLSFKLKEYVSANIDKELSLALLGKELGVGRTYLCTICKRDFGMTVNELIRTTRIEHAKKLLQAGNEAISAIAKRVGIFDYNYFSKVFKTETGLAPSTFRRLCEDDNMYQAGNIS